MAQQRTKPKQPTKGERERFKAEYGYGECRTLGHDWPRRLEVGNTLEVLPHGLVEVTIACRSCGTEKREIFSLRTGLPQARSYRYAEGYQTRGWGEWVPARSEWRRDYFQTLVSAASRRRRIKAV